MTENDISYVIRGAGKEWNKADCKQFIGFCIVLTIHPIIQSTNILLGDANANAIAKLSKSVFARWASVASAFKKK